jgi:hypothetical protein
MAGYTGYRSVHGYDPTRLPGDVERGTCTARMEFRLDGHPTEVRYFTNQAAALRVKAAYSGIWCPCNVQYWHFKELTWIG